MSLLPPAEHAEALKPAPAPPSAWREWVTGLLDLVFPALCPVCRGRLDAGRRDPLCGPCWQRLPRITPPACRVCGVPFLQFTVAGDSPVATSPADPGRLCGGC